MARRAKSFVSAASDKSAVEDVGRGKAQVVTRLQELVRTGNLRPGDRLPPERELIDIFGISRPSLREAMQSLSVLGVIEARHGGGVFITDLQPARLLAPLDFYMSLSTTNLADTFEARRLVEVDIARRSAHAPSWRDADELKTMLAAHASVLDDPVGFRILDSRLHDKLYAMGGSPVLHRIARGLYNLGLDLRRRATAEFGAIPQSEGDHRRIVEAVLDRDPASAASAMTDHLAHIEASTRRMLDLERSRCEADEVQRVVASL